MYIKNFSLIGTMNNLFYKFLVFQQSISINRFDLILIKIG